MEKELGKNYASMVEREQFLKNNCDSAEQLSYTRKLTKGEIEDLSQKLVDNNVSIRDVKEEKADAMQSYNSRLKALQQQQDDILEKLRTKTEFMKNEQCYKMLDFDEKRAGYYNKYGDLVHERALTPDEMQLRIPFRITGTED